MSEGALSWQFPAGAVEPGESATDAAVREAREETGITVKAARTLGERIHPVTGRTMIYVACDLVTGDAAVVDDDELSDLAWAGSTQLADHIPHGFYPAVHEYLDSSLH